MRINKHTDKTKKIVIDLFKQGFYVYPQRRNNYYDKSLAFNEKIERVPYEQKVKARLIAALR